MKEIHLEISPGKNSRIGLTRAKSQKPKLVLKTLSNREVFSQRVATGETRTQATGDTLKQQDPEIDLHLAGKILVNPTRGYSCPGQRKLEGGFQLIDTTYTSSGEVKERKPHVTKRANINEAVPVKVGRRVPLNQAVRQFVFCNQLALFHDDGLKYDFLFALAKELHEKQEVAALGAGPKGNLPLVFQENGSPYRAFLFGEVDGAKYRLLVLLTNQELKMPEAVEKLKTRKNQTEVLDL
jgi:hypothetical protein